jgi:hypothetical protein
MAGPVAHPGRSLDPPPFRLCRGWAFLSIDRPKEPAIQGGTELPRTRIFKVGAATVAAAAGVILAITSVMAHSTSTSTLHASGKSVAASALQAEEQKERAAAAAALLAAEQRKAAQLAAKAQKEAAEAQAEAAESAAEAQDETADATEPADTTQTEDKTGPDTEHDFTGEESGDN